jgi:hypothetical protein
MSLSVVSAFGRLGVDPWREAARLAGLPEAAAANALAALIARLPGEAIKDLNVAARTGELIRLLPTGVSSAAPARRKSASPHQRKSTLRFTMICLVLAIAAFGTALAGRTFFSGDDTMSLSSTSRAPSDRGSD